MKKINLIFFIMLFFSLIFSISAECAEVDTEAIIEEQKEIIEADSLFDAIPEEARKSLSSLGIDEMNFENLNSIGFVDFFTAILNIATNNLKTGGHTIVTLLGIILICSITYGLKLSSANINIEQMINIAGTLSMCVALVDPIISLIKEASNIIVSSSNFMLIYVPVMASLLISSGESVKGTTYYSMMMLAGQTVNQLSSRVIVPILNMYLGLSIVSSISVGMNLKGICDMFYKTIRWVLGFVMSIFVSILTIQGLISTSADTASSRAMRFAVRSFVPVVGGALSDAYLSVQTCVKMLKSGIGVVGMIATGFIYLPILFKCIFWLFGLNICSSACDLFDLRALSSIISSITKVISTIIAILLCCMAVFIISTAIMMIIGGF